MLIRILRGFLLIALGGVVCYYSYQIVQWFGRNARAELHLGGTRNAVLLFGFFVMVLGVLTVFGLFSVSSPTDTMSVGFSGE